MRIQLYFFSRKAKLNELVLLIQLAIYLKDNTKIKVIKQSRTAVKINLHTFYNTNILHGTKYFYTSEYSQIIKLDQSKIK